VNQAIQQLPARRRELFILARFHGMGYRQIADVAGISVQTVANQMSAAITQLTRTLSPVLANTGGRRGGDARGPDRLRRSLPARSVPWPLGLRVAAPGAARGMARANVRLAGSMHGETPAM
jgi:hypothetical protein